MKSTAYYRWHCFRFAKAVHVSVLIAYIIVTSAIIRYSFIYPAPQSASATNTQTKTWTFDTTNASNYTYSAPVTLDDTGLKPPANKFSNANFATNTTGWDATILPSSGWVLVPGNGTFGTSDFLVMKYEAKCAATSDLTTGLTTPTYTTTHTYDYNATNCTAANNKQVVSTTTGYPIGDITQTEAIALGGTLGTGYHLITNNEYMTISRNIEQKASNWSVGVGSGYLYSGHNDNAPAYALEASADDSLGYTGEANSGGNQRRTLTLSNNSIIWDLAGNVFELTSDIHNPAIDTTTSYVEWDHSNVATGARDLYDPSNASWLSANGMGQVMGGPLNNSVARGGSFTATVNAGIYNLYLLRVPSFRAWYQGVRYASNPVSIVPTTQSSISRAGNAPSFAVTGVADGTFTQSINVGDTGNYSLSAYAYNNTADSIGGTVDSTVASLYVNGAAIATSYSPVTGAAGWYKLTNTNPVVGADASRTYGMLIKSGKTVVADDMTLAKTGTYSAYTTLAHSDSDVIAWDSFAASESNTSANGTISYQLCPDDGSTCESGSSWQYWTGSAWATATDINTTHTNTAAALTPTAMQALPVTNKKLAVKSIITIEGATAVPALSNIVITYSLPATETPAAVPPPNTTSDETAPVADTSTSSSASSPVDTTSAVSSTTTSPSVSTTQPALVATTPTTSATGTVAVTPAPAEAIKAKIIEAEKSIKTTGSYESEIIATDQGTKVLSVFAVMVKDTNGNPLANKTVTLHSSPQTVVTNENGLAIFTNVEAGKHTLSYATSKNKTVEVALAIDLPDTQIATTDSTTTKLTPLTVTVTTQRPVYFWLTWVLLVLLVITMATIIIRGRKKALKQSNRGI